MSEKTFYSCILTEGVFSFILGICLLLLPKITPLSFGFVLNFALIAYGGYKAINAYCMKNLSLHYILTAVSGVCLFLSGILLMFFSVVSLVQIIAIIGVYFLLESISTSALAFQTNSVLKCFQSFYIISFLQLLFGIVTIFILPSAAIWIASLMLSFDLLFFGIVLINVYFATIYSK